MLTPLSGTTLANLFIHRGLTYIFPAQCSVTVFTVDVGYCVQSREQQPLLCRTTADVHPESKQSLQTAAL